MKLYKSVKGFLARNGLAVGCLCFVLVFWSVRLLAMHVVSVDDFTYHYNSDEVAQQNILWDWQHGYHERATVGDDNWVIKYPLYVIINNLPLSPSIQLFTSAWILMMSTAVLIFWVSREFINRLVKHQRTRDLSLVIVSLFLASLPTTVFYILRMPNSRNIEIGIGLFLLLQLYEYLHNPKWAKKYRLLKILSLVAITGVLMANDPLFLYFGLAPLMAAIAWIYYRGGIKFYQVKALALFSVGSLVVFKATRFLLIHLTPIALLEHKSRIVSFDQFLVNLKYFFSYGLQSFGIDIWGRQLGEIITVRSILFFIILLCSIYGLAIKYRSNNKSLFYTYLLLVVAINLGVCLTSNTIDGSNMTRYNILFTPIEIIGLILFATSLKIKRQTYIVTAVLVTLCFSMGIYMAKRLAHVNVSETREQNIVSILEQEGLKKGYSGYWDAGITTFLSDHEVHLFPVLCSGSPSELYFFDVLTERSPITKLVANKSFYVYASAETEQCSPEKLEPSLGKPIKLISVNDPKNTIIAVYDHDISSKVHR